MRKVLQSSQLSAVAQSAIVNFHPALIEQVESAIQKKDYVIVGMAFNPHCSIACKALDKKNLQYEYIEIGGYLSKWKERLALKMWSGWPTYPMVFSKGQLVGGRAELLKSLNV